ncbi:late-transcription coactivator [Synechococcus phage S-CREM1]|nr:late-transcription coactivator [Synechococcus phage S-CREM1]
MQINDSAEDKFLTSTKFSEDIERIVKESGGLVNYIEAIVTYCEENEIELETVSKLISKPLKEKLKYQAQNLNYMKKTSRGILPL